MASGVAETSSSSTYLRKTCVRGPIPHDEVEGDAQHSNDYGRVAEGRPPSPFCAHLAGDPPHQYHGPASGGAHKTQGQSSFAPWPPLGDHADGRGPAGGVGEPCQPPRDGHSHSRSRKAGDDVENRGEDCSQQHPQAKAIGLAKSAVEDVANPEPSEQHGVNQPNFQVTESQVVFDQRGYRPEVEPSQIEEQVEARKGEQDAPLEEVVPGREVVVVVRLGSIHLSFD